MKTKKPKKRSSIQARMKAKILKEDRKLQAMYDARKLKNREYLESLKTK